MRIKTLVLLTCLVSFALPIGASLTKVKSRASSESEDPKRTKALTEILYEQTVLPLELINIINEYDKTYDRIIVAKHGAPIHALVLFPDGKLASGGKDGTVKLWDPKGKPLKTLHLHTKSVTTLLVVSGKLYAGSLDGTITIYNTIDNSTHTLPIENAVGALLRLSDTEIACGSWGEFIYVWKSSGQPVKQFYFEPKGWWDSLWDPYRYHHAFALAFLPEHKWIVSGDRGQIKAWDLQSAAPVVRREIRSMAYTTYVFVDVYALLTLPHDHILSAWGDGAIRIFDPETEQCLKTLKGHRGAVRSLCLISPSIFASGSDDKTIKLWDMTKEHDPKKKDQSIKTFVGHTAGVTALVKLDEHTLISASEDGTIRRWPLE